MCHRIHVRRLAILGGLLLGCGPVAASAQAQGESFTATASLKTKAGAQVTAPVTVVVTRLTTDKERAALVETLKKSGSAGVVKSLEGMGEAGYIEIGERKTPVKYAHVNPLSGGRLVTVIAPTPIVHLGGGLPGAQPKKGFDLALVILEVKDSGAGTGELAPAATIKINDAGAIQTEDYGAEVVKLTNVQAKK